jgi:hypothetical protein
MYTYAALNRFFGDESENESSEVSERFLDFLSDEELPRCDKLSFVELLNKRNVMIYKLQVQQQDKVKDPFSLNNSQS